MLMVGLFSLSALADDQIEQWSLTGEAKKAWQKVEQHWNSLGADNQSYAKWGSMAVGAVTVAILVMMRRGTKDAVAVPGTDNEDGRETSQERHDKQD